MASETTTENVTEVAYEKAPETPKVDTTVETEATPTTEAYEKVPDVPKEDTADAPSKKCSARTVGNVCIGIGALLVVGSVAFSLAMPSVVTSKINSSLFFCSADDLKKEAFTDRYGDCKECNPYYFNLFFFNVTNAEAYLQGAKMQVQEVGPYSYRRREIRVDGTIDKDGWMTYKQYSYHQFDKEHSCKTCTENDLIMSWDIGYLNVIAQAGGEKGFLRRLIAGTMWGPMLTPAQQDDLIKANGTQIMKWVNGLNSYDPAAVKVVASSVTPFLTTGMKAISNLDLTGFAYNGLFNLRPVVDYALGYPSLLAGLALGTNYVNVCQTGMSDKCAKCKGAECVPIAGECKRCKLGAQVVALNTLTCARLQKQLTGKLGAEVASSFIEGTCGSMCEGLGLCAAPLPGYAESSGLDFSKKAPPASDMKTFVENSGCHDKTLINEYKQYDGYTATPLWVQLDSRRNPTLEEINNFGTYATCVNSPANISCSVVHGNDGTAVKPLGASLTGFPDAATAEEIMMFVASAYQNVSLHNTREVVDDFEGIKLTRFMPDHYLLSRVPWQDSKGTGFPVDGVQPLAFPMGFLAYMTYPFYFFANETLLDNVEMTTIDGVKAKKDVFFDSKGELKKEMFDRYATFCDVEPGTGRAMRGRKRLQASYALAKSQFTANTPMTDVMYPNLTAEVLAPMFYGEESATAKSETVSSFKDIKHLLASLLPVLIVGSVVGLILIVRGIFYHKQHKATTSKTEMC